MTYVTHIQYKNWNLQSISLENGDTCWIFYGFKIYKDLISLIQTKLLAHGFRNNSQLGLTSLWENCVWWLYFKSLTCDTLLALKIMMCNICIALNYFYNFGFLSQQSNVSISTLEYFGQVGSTISMAFQTLAKLDKAWNWVLPSGLWMSFQSRKNKEGTGLLLAIGLNLCDTRTHSLGAFFPKSVK